jgi:hypothetical protein
MAFERRYIMKVLRALACISLIIFLGLPSFGEEKPSAEEIMTKSHLAFYYPGEDMRGTILMRLITRDGKERIRELTMLRRNSGKEGEQRYFIYFHKPPDVKDMTFMVWSYPGKNDDRWLFIPAIKLVKRIAANDKRSSFVGSDFSYEDISGREVEEDNHSIIKEELFDGKDTYVMKSVPKDEGTADYSHKLSWIDKKGFIPLKEEYYDKRGELYKVFTADEVKEIQGFPTITKRTMKNVQSGHRTEVTLEEVGYNNGIEDDIFSERYLRNPPRKWIR